MTHIIDVDFSGALSVDGVALGTYLTRKEYGLLRAVMGSSAVASRDFILSALYGGMDEPELKIIDVFATKLRKKLGDHRDAIRTCWGWGYYRNPDYQLSPETDGTLAVSVNSKALEDLSHFTGEAPDQLVGRLMREELERLWPEAA